MIIIRLSRVGKTKQPSYRMVVQDKRRDPWGKALDIVGFYNPRSKPKTFTCKADRIEYWLSKGAAMSATVNNLLVTNKVIKSEKVKATPSKHSGGKPKTEEKKEEEKKA